MTHRVDAAAEDLAVPVLVWATQLDDRGGSFLDSVSKRNEVVRVAGEPDDELDLEILEAIRAEFTTRVWQDLNVSVWFMNEPTAPDSHSDLAESVFLWEYRIPNRYLQSVEVVQAFMRRLKGQCVRDFTARHVDTGTVLTIPALHKYQAFWKWATESSAGLFNPWDLINECVNLVEMWVYYQATGRDWHDFEKIAHNYDLVSINPLYDCTSHFESWCALAKNDEVTHPDPEQVMRLITRRFEKVVVIE